MTKATDFMRKHWPKIAILALLLLFTVVKIPTFGITYVNRDEPLYAWQSLAIYNSPEMLFSPEISYWYAFALIPAMASPLNVFFDAHVAVRIVTFAFSLLGLLFTYLVGKKMFSEKIGIAAMVFLLLSPIFFYSTNKAMPDVPIAALGILLLYLLLTLNKRRAALIPLVVLAMYLIRASSLVVLPPMIVFLLIKYREKINWRQAALALIATTCLAAIGYMLSPYAAWDPLRLFTVGMDYGMFFALKAQNFFWVALGIPISFYAILGLRKLGKKPGLNTGLLLLWIFLTIIPFLLFKRTQDRYYLLAVPPMAIIASWGFFWLLEKKKHVLGIATAAIVVLILFSSAFSYNPYLVEYKKPYSSQTLDDFEAFLLNNLGEDDRLVIVCDEFIMRAYRASAEKVLQNPREQMIVRPGKEEFEAIVAENRNCYLLAYKSESKRLFGIGSEDFDHEIYLTGLGFEKMPLFPEEEIAKWGLPELYKKPGQ